ncbi:MAG: RDD family protein [Vicinamibacterales bacterium]
MKCPKCAYVGFESTDRCRHCGYDFSLMSDGVQAMPVDLAPPVPPAADDTLTNLALDPAPPAVAVGAEDLPLREIESRVPSLFSDPLPPPAGAPLAVRRAAAERPRTRGGPRLVRSRPTLVPLADEAEAAPAGDAGDSAPMLASVSARIGAAALDIGLLAVVDLTVVYLTAQLAGVPLIELLTLPLVPLAVFLVGLDVAYLLVFTAQGGQTLGKMAFGLRVEGVDETLTVARAFVRVAASMLSLGAGLGSAALRSDRRALHDHVADTHVVKVRA